MARTTNRGIFANLKTQIIMAHSNNGQLQQGCSLTEVEEVAKIGIRTGYNKGHIIEDAKVRWNPESTGPLTIENEMAQTILFQRISLSRVLPRLSGERAI
jgi:hypothetical protein